MKKEQDIRMVELLEVGLIETTNSKLKQSTINFVIRFPKNPIIIQITSSVKTRAGSIGTQKFREKF